MLLDIKPFRNGILNCTEDSIATILRWLGYDHELLYSKAWWFEYRRDMQSNGNIGKRIFPTRSNNLVSILKEYYYIEIATVQATDKANFISEVKEQLFLRKPVLITLDMYWAPWDKCYKINHSEHSLIISGYNEVSEQFHCIDAFIMQEGLLLPADCLEQGCLWYSVMSIKEHNRLHICYEDVIKNVVSEVQCESIFNSIRDFADDVEKHLDIESEIYGYDQIWQVPLVYNLESVDFGRRKFAMLLKYFAENQNNDSLLTLSDKFDLAGSKWGAFRRMLLKYSVARENTGIRNTVADKIRKIADYEESLASELYNICSRRESVCNNPYHSSMVNLNRKNKSSIKTFLVDLTEHFNNNAFGSILSKECTADLSGLGAYFLSKGLPEGDIWNIENMKFKFPTLEDGKNDNVSCCGQNISFTGGYFSSIALIACCDVGCFSDTLTINYDDGQTEEIIVKLTDISASNPVYGETVACEVDCVERDNNGEVNISIRGRILAKEYCIQGKGMITGITLPHCPGIHIFAISLNQF